MVSNPEKDSITAIFCGWDEPAIGATQACQEAGRDEILIVGVDGEEFCDVPKLDWILWNFFRMVRYGRADRAHNVWNCRRCGHLQQFEADGPFENGWNLCPVCGGVVLRPASNGQARS